MAMLRRFTAAAPCVLAELRHETSDSRSGPERYADFKVKDRVEERLQAAVCVEHTLTPQQAQAAIAHDWTHSPVGLPR